MMDDMTDTEMSGETFNELFPEAQVVELLSSDGLSACLATKENAGLHIRCNGNVMTMFRDVIIPSDGSAYIHISKNKLVCSGEILRDEIKPISGDYEFMKMILKKNPSVIINLDENVMTKELCQIASQNDPTWHVRNLGFVRKIMGFYGR